MTRRPNALDEPGLPPQDAACVSNWYQGRALCYGGVWPGIRCPCPLTAARLIRFVDALVTAIRHQGETN